MKSLVLKIFWPWLLAFGPEFGLWPGSR